MAGVVDIVRGPGGQLTVMVESEQPACCLDFRGYPLQLRPAVRTLLSCTLWPGEEAYAAVEQAFCERRN